MRALPGISPYPWVVTKAQALCSAADTHTLQYRIQKPSAATKRPTATEVQALQRDLATGLPPGISLYFAAAVPAEFRLTPEEEDCSRKHSPKRLDQFIAGRYSASEAMRRLGMPRAPIPIGASRQPLWPPSVIGSIAHTDGVAGAIVARGATCAGLGIDIEYQQPMQEIAGHICTDNELELARTRTQPDIYLSILFSAKEAVYKCLWPMVRRFVPFQSIELALDFRSRRFSISWQDDVSPAADTLEGCWATRGGLVATVAIAPPDELD